MRFRTLVPVVLLFLALPLVAEDASERAGKLLNRAIENASRGESAGTISFDKEVPEDILAFSWGVTNTGTFSTGGGAGAGKATFSDFAFVKRFDKSSPNLMKGCATGKHIKDVTVTLKDRKGTTYMVIKFSDVLISSYQTGGSAGNDDVFDSITLNFAKAEIDGILIGL